MKNKAMWLIGIALIAVFLLTINPFAQNIIPDGEVRTAEQCDFITNAPINNYGQPGQFIVFEGKTYAYNGVSSRTCLFNEAQLTVGETPEGRQLCHSNSDGLLDTRTLYLQYNSDQSYAYSITPSSSAGETALDLGDDAYDQCLIDNPTEEETGNNGIFGDFDLNNEVFNLGSFPVTWLTLLIVGALLGALFLFKK